MPFEEQHDQFARDGHALSDRVVPPAVPFGRNAIPLLRHAAQVSFA